MIKYMKSLAMQYAFGVAINPIVKRVNPLPIRVYPELSVYDFKSEVHWYGKLLIPGIEVW